MLTQQDRDYHAVYESMPKDLQDTVKDAFQAAVDVLRDAGQPCPMDDRAESLVAALARYVYENGE